MMRVIQFNLRQADGGALIQTFMTRIGIENANLIVQLDTNGSDENHRFRFFLHILIHPQTTDPQFPRGQRIGSHRLAVLVSTLG